MGYHTTTDISHYHQGIHRHDKIRKIDHSQHGIHVARVQTSSLCDLVVSHILYEKSAKAALAAQMATLWMWACLVQRSIPWLRGQIWFIRIN